MKKILIFVLSILILASCGQIGENRTTGESSAPETFPESAAETAPPETVTDTAGSGEEEAAEPIPFRELRFTAAEGYRSPMLIRITSAEEREAVYYALITEAYLDEAYDYTYGYDPDLFTGWLSLTENYDEAWFESHDLYIAAIGEDSSTPKYSAQITDGNRIVIRATHHELISDDLIGRHILLETEKGRELIWDRTDGICFTADDLFTDN